MNPTQAARELGKAIQADERFKAYIASKKTNDDDKALQELILDFNLQRERLTAQVSANEKEKEQSKIAELNVKMRETYEQIMTNENMKNFTRAKSEVDIMINEVNQIIALCCEGADPETCEPRNCGGGCGSCGGCG